MGVAMMLSQLGYALGMLLLVPLGDGRERRGLMTTTALAAAVMLGLTALVPGYRGVRGRQLRAGIRLLLAAAGGPVRRRRRCRRPSGARPSAR